MPTLRQMLQSKRAGQREGNRLFKPARCAMGKTGPPAPCPPDSLCTKLPRERLFENENGPAVKESIVSPARGSLGTGAIPVLQSAFYPVAARASIRPRCPDSCNDGPLCHGAKLSVARRSGNSMSMNLRHAAALALVAIVLTAPTMVRYAYAQDARIGVVCGDVDDGIQGVGSFDLCSSTTKATAKN